MNTLQNNFTTPEQSKRLLELGVPADSADCIRVIATNMVLFIQEGRNAEYYIDKYNNERNVKAEPCWSVGRLMEIYDMCFISPKSRSSWCTHTRVKGILFVDYILDCYKNAITDKLLDFSKLEE